MNVARVVNDGFISIPIGIRKKLNIKDGDKIIFMEESGRIVIENSTLSAIKEMQNTMKTEAEKAGIFTEADVDSLIDEIRTERNTIR